MGGDKSTPKSQSPREGKDMKFNHYTYEQFLKLNV